MIEVTHDGQVIAVISLVIVGASTWVRLKMLDREKLKAHKEKLKEHQEALKDAQKRGDTKRAKKAMDEMMAVTNENLMHTIKPTMVTLIPLLIIFGWLGRTYGGVGAVQNVTLIEVLPQGIQTQNLVLTGNGTYSSVNNSIVWFIPQVPAMSNGSVYVNLTAYNSTKLDFDKPALMEYVWRNKTRGYASSDGENKVINIKRVILNSGEKFEYKIDYSNNAPYKVASVLGYDLGWLGWYIVCSMVISLTLNKALGIT